MLLADCSAMELVAIRMIEKRWKCLKLVLNFKMFHVITFKKMIFILLLINFEAIFDLGNIFLGIDGKKDEDKAFTLFELGASLKDDDGRLVFKIKSYNCLAIDMLGYCYFNGLGCEIDKEKGK